MNIEDIEGIGPAYAQKLRAVGIGMVEDLLDRAATAADRHAVSQETGIADRLILTWVNHADLCRIDGINPGFAELLEAAGVDSVPELAQRRPDNLQAKMAAVNAEKHLNKDTPNLDQVTDWVAQAKKMQRVVEH